MTGTIAVAIHDVEPRSYQRVLDIRAWLFEHGIDRVTLLVIPASELHPIGARAPALVEWLHQRAASGDAVAQHGLAHRPTGHQDGGRHEQIRVVEPVDDARTGDRVWIALCVDGGQQRADRPGARLEDQAEYQGGGDRR